MFDELTKCSNIIKYDVTYITGMCVNIISTCLIPILLNIQGRKFVMFESLYNVLMMVMNVFSALFNR